MKFLTAAQLSAANGRRFTTVDVPGTDGDSKLRIGSLTAAKALQFRALNARQEKGEDVEQEVFAFVLEACCVDGNGRPLFTAQTARDYLDSVDIAVAGKLVEQISDFITRDPAVTEVAKTTENAEGNSAGSQSAS